MNYEVNWKKIRIRILYLGTAMGILGLVLGFILMWVGATGKFEILGEGKGVKIFITSVSPGIFLAIVGGIVNIVALRLQAGNIGMPTPKHIKARGGAEYYRQETSHNAQQKNAPDKK
ncbi:hypothetical protein KA005_31730 [bacterium]|nr:hypothetical protein [bacterium]